MKFQIKMVIVYALLGIAAAFMAGSIYYFASVQKINERELQAIEISAKQIEQQYDEMLISMKDLCYYMLSDKDTLAAITSISNMGRSPQYEKLFSGSRKGYFCAG